MHVDFGRTAEDYARHRAGFPEELFERLAAQGIGRAGQCVLDLGTGTGSLARGFARGGARVTALDISGDLLALAVEEGVEIETLRAPAEDSGLPDASFEAVTAGQCWHWFDRPGRRTRRTRVSATSRASISRYRWPIATGTGAAVSGPAPGSAAAWRPRRLPASMPRWRRGLPPSFPANRSRYRTAALP